MTKLENLQIQALQLEAKLAKVKAELSEVRYQIKQEQALQREYSKEEKNISTLVDSESEADQS